MSARPIAFYTMSGSPYGWRVQLALEHKKLAYERHILSWQGGDLEKPAYLALNPRARVPSIVDGDLTLYESAAIVEYLDDAYPEAPLFPRDVHARAIARRRIREADEYVGHPMETLVGQVLFTKPEARDAALVARTRDELAEELPRWEGQLAGGWLSGDGPGAADYTLYPLVALLRRMESRSGAFSLKKEEGPALAAFMERIEKLPFYDATYPPHWRP